MELKIILNELTEKRSACYQTQGWRIRWRWKIQTSIYKITCCAVLSSAMSDSLWPHGLQLARLLCPWGFSRQEYWRGLPCPPPGDLPDPGIKPRSPTLQIDSLLSEPPGKSKNIGVYPFSIAFLSFIDPIFAWNVPLVSLIFLKRSLVFPILFFSSISLHWSLRKAFLSLLAILWNSAFRCLYLSFSALLFASLPLWCKSS